MRTHMHTRAMLSCGVNVMKMPVGCWSDCAEDGDRWRRERGKHKPWRKMNGYLVITQSDGCDSSKLTSMCGQAEVLPAFTFLQYTLCDMRIISATEMPLGNFIVDSCRMLTWCNSTRCWDSERWFSITQRQRQRCWVIAVLHTHAHPHLNNIERNLKNSLVELVNNY